MKLLAFELLILINLCFNHASIVDLIKHPIKGSIGLVNNQNKLTGDLVKEVNKNVQNLIRKPQKEIKGFADHSPDEERRAPQLIQSRGYQSEEYKVITEDGYILTLFRIVNQYINSTNKPVVFLQHGVFRSCDDWIEISEGGLDSRHNYYENGGSIVNHSKSTRSNPPGNTLGFVLADCGYDVWLGNSRGTTYSSSHQTLSKTDPRFWQYSFQQMGEYDLPASIDFVLKKTGQKSLTLIAHSQGTSQAFAMLSSNEKHSQKVNKFIALAPVVYFDDFNPVKFEPILGSAFDLLGITKTVSKGVQVSFRSAPGPANLHFDQFIALFTDPVCNVLKNVIHCGDQISGSASIHINKTRANVFFRHLDTTSSWCLAHYAQMISSLRFEKFQTNDMQIPEQYDLSKIDSSKVALIYSDKDIFQSEKAVERLKDNLQTNGRKLLADFKVPCDGWTHLDFVNAKDNGKCVNWKVLQLLNIKI